MSQNKVLSISIAAYNVEKTILECLTPFLECKQLDKIEVLIISDGSTDNTDAICKDFIKKNGNSFRLIQKTNGGWGSTLNIGIKEATGKFFRQLDGDDYYDPKNLDRLVTYLEQCNADIVASPFCHFSDTTNAITGFYGFPEFFSPNTEIYLSETKDFYPPPMHSISVRSKVLKDNDIRITEKCFYTDVEFVLKAINNSNSISFFELPIYYYRLGRDGQSMSISGVRKHYMDHEKMLIKMIKYMQEESKDSKKAEIIRARLIEATMYQYKFFLALSGKKKHLDDFRKFDHKLSILSEDIYNQNYGLPIRILRKTNFNFFKPISTIKNYQDKKHKVFLYEQ